MSKVTTLKCDFCGRDESKLSGPVIRHKVKRQYYGGYIFNWYKVDICVDCLAEIRRKVRVGKE